MVDSASTLFKETTERLTFERGAVLANRYEMKRPLGRGGMGEVWLAYDLRLRVEVALKTLLPSADRPESLHAEIRAAREVISPNVCRVFDLVETEGRELLSMEFVDGTTLRELLNERSPFDFVRAQEIAAQFLAGLEAIHAAGLVHRDFKPENVMLTRTGRVVVMDFGLAKAATDESNSIAGTRPYMAPEQLAGRPADRRSDIFAASVVLAEMLDPEGVHDADSRRRVWSSVRETPPRVAEAPCSSIIRRGLAVDPKERPDTAAAVARSLEEVRRRIGLTEEKSPYPGLASFTEADAQNFFGRDSEIAAIWKRLGGPPRLLGVIGPSGAGKSSLMRAGIIPARPEGWRAVIAAPGPRPFMSLAAALAPDLAGDVDAITSIAGIEQPDVAVKLFSVWRRRHTGALLIVDQFEELFTLASPDAQARFAAVVARLPIESDVHVVLSMRDDFLMRCHDYEALTPLFSELIPLRPPAGDALRRALVQPALNNGYRFEDEALVEEIMTEISDERAALPLGAFAMSCLWEKRDRQNGTMTRAAYEQIGGVAGALARHADATLDAIGTERSAIVREIFRNLVTAHGTRVSRDREELLSIFPDRHEAGDVLDALIHARLLTSYEEGRVEIIHESLLRSWPRLVQWQAQDTEGALFREHLRKAAELWEERGRPEELLWSGNEHREYEVWRSRYAGALSTREEVFAQQMDAAAQRHTRRRQFAITAVLLLALAITTTFGLLWRQSVAAARLAEAQKLLALAEVVLEQQEGPTGALAYATKSLEIADTSEARLRILEILQHGPVKRALSGKQVSATMYLKFSPDGKWLLVTSPFGPGELFSIEGGGSKTLPTPPIIHGQAAMFSRDSRFLAVQGFDDISLRVYTIPGGQRVRDVPNQRGRFALTDRIVTFTPTSDRKAIVRSWPIHEGEAAVLGTIDLPHGFIRERQQTEEQDILEWNLQTTSVTADGSIFYPEGESVYRVRIGSSRPEHVWRVGEKVQRISAFEEGILVAQTTTGLSVRLRDGTSRSLLASQIGADTLIGPYDFKGSRVAFVARTGRDPRLRIWDLAAPVASVPVEPSRSPHVSDAAFDPSGRWVAFNDSGPKLWPLAQPLPYVFRHMNGGGLNNPVQFMPDSESFLTCGIQGGLRIFSTGSTEPPRIAFPSTRCTTQAISRDGSRIAAGNYDLYLIEPKAAVIRSLLRNGGDFVTASAVDPSGNVVAALFNGPVQKVHMVDLRSDIVTSFPVAGEPLTGMGAALAFAADGTLYVSGRGGIRRCDVSKQKCEPFRAAPFARMAMSAGGQFLLVSLSADKDAGQRRLFLLDLKQQTERRIDRFGDDFMALAINTDGRLIATTGRSGMTRVGRPTDNEPHLIPLRVGGLGIAISSDGKWLSTFWTGEPRLIPMPDLSKPPLHTLPHDELIARLREMTNLRAVRDDTSPTGYKLEIGPFPGWRRTPRWQ